MLFRMIYDDRLAQAAYLIGCQKTGEAIIVDPERDIDRYLEVARREGLRVTAIAETHIHADYLSGARELAERTGAKLYVSDEGGPDWTYQWLNQKSGGGSYSHQLLRGGDVFRVGMIEFQALHTPGHTPEHVCFLVTDRGGGATEPIGLLSGDLLFVGDLGRPDLLETAAGQAGAKEPSARLLWETVRKLTTLPEYLQVWPAHGAGSACGKALGAVPQTTLGYEKRYNPALKIASGEQEPFVDFILSGQPEPPLYFARMKRDNKLGPPILGDVPNPRELTTADLQKLDAREVAVIDTRAWPEFRSGHIPGALSLIPNKTFPTNAGSFVTERTPIYLIAEAKIVDELVRDLIRVGLDDIRGFATPATLKSYVESSSPIETTTETDVFDAAKRITAGEVHAIDVRSASEFADGHIDGARNVAHTRLAAHLRDLPKDKPLLVSCQSGFRSARATSLLQRAGFDATNVAGGFLAWRQNGLPIVS